MREMPRRRSFTVRSKGTEIESASSNEAHRPQAEAAMERVVSQQKLMMEQRFLREGHAFASMRAAAHFSVEAAMNERCSGVSYYHFLCGLQEEADWAGLGRRLEALRQKVLGGNALTVSLHGSDAALDT